MSRPASGPPSPGLWHAPCSSPSRPPAPAIRRTRPAPSGESAALDASLAEEAKSQTKKDAATIGGATAGGAILGRIPRRDDKTEGGTIGAIVGAAVGTAIAARNEGENVELLPGTRLEIVLDEWVRVLVPDAG